MAKPTIDVTGTVKLGRKVRIVTNLPEPNKPESVLMGRVEAYQNGEIVYRQYGQIFEGEAAFTLGPTRLWTEGAADGYFTVGYFTGKYRERLTVEIEIEG